MSDAVWYLVRGGQSVGPMTREALLAALPGEQGDDTLVFGPGLTTWIAAKHVADLRRNDFEPEVPPPAVGVANRRRSDELDYALFGDDMQYLEVELDPGEMVIAEAGAMMFMQNGIEMQTQFGDPSQQTGFFGKLMSAGKRMLTGESLFMTTFTCRGPGKQRVAFAAPHPGKIIPMDLAQLGGELLCQKDSFLAAARGVSVGIAFTKKIGAGLFGGEGFILQRLTGDGLAFIHAGGTLCHKKLGPGEVLKVDTGCIVGFEPSVQYDIKFVGGIKNTLFGGEGLFFAQLVGPGNVWLQSLPFARLADRINAGAAGKEQGSILGGLGNILDGDGN